MSSNSLRRVAAWSVLAVAVVGGAYWVRREKPTAPPPPQVTTTQPALPVATVPVQPAPAPVAIEGPSCVGTLLTQEPILTRNGIILLMGHATGEAAIRLPKSCRPASLDSLFAMTPAGPRALTVDRGATNATMPWGCAKEIPAFGMRMTQAMEQDDMLVASGAKVPTVLQWTPAVQNDITVECAAPRPDYQSEEQRTFQIPGDSASRWLVEAWRPPVDPLEIPQDAGVRPVSRVVVLSRLSGTANECTTQDSAEANDTSPPTRNAGRYRRVYGMLKAKDAKEEKSWIIFESGSDEARAVVAIAMDARGQLQTRQRDSWFYSGC